MSVPDPVLSRGATVVRAVNVTGLRRRRAESPDAALLLQPFEVDAFLALLDAAFVSCSGLASAMSLFGVEEGDRERA